MGPPQAATGTSPSSSGGWRTGAPESGDSRPRGVCQQRCKHSPNRRTNPWPQPRWHLLQRKRLFLIALASARRRSCLHALSTKQNHIRFENHGVRMVPDPAFLAKNQVLSFLPGDIFIPEIKSLSSIAEDKLWCPVRALKWYLNKTQHLRGTTTTLFILPRAPYSAASKDTISRWLAEIIRPFTTGTITPRAHDIRGVAASTALFAGVPVEDILKAAAWRTPTTFVTCYLSDSLQAETAFCSAVMRGPAGIRSHPSGLPPSGSATRC
ncbi:hypothetical protein BSL78_01807 [Apostichopus japonicus]|uniref:Tyr recombinase domain-containing protein n=1 Tax=Stichopus japonicus TaxID=307972 RepID=A0A2G8LLV7_STIJA|nr:hypothetical protein BSL78_01807 [Apostichopus japonicus]